MLTISRISCSVLLDISDFVSIFTSMVVNKLGTALEKWLIFWHIPPLSNPVL